MKLDSKPAVLGGEATFPEPLPMARPRLPKGSTLLSDFEQIVDSGQLTKGRHLAQFEENSKEYLGVEHAKGVSSCTSGLMLCLQALRRRLGRRGKVAVPSFTFLASITALTWADFEPVFVDVDPRTMNICLTDLERVLQRESVDAVLAVHCFGNPVPLRQLEKVTAASGAKLMFDAAHGFGSIESGQKVGHGGWCQVFSLTPTKMVVAGEGGLVVTSDPKLAEEIQVGREYGNDGSYDTLFPGLNARLSELHSCLATASLEMLDEIVEHRNKVACALTGALKEVPGIGFQTITPDSRTTYKDFTITIEPKSFGMSRDRAAEALLAEGIPSRKYFSPACHQHRAFSEYGDCELPGTIELADRCLSIPLLDLDSVPGIGDAFRKLHCHAEEL